MTITKSVVCINKVGENFIILLLGMLVLLSRIIADKKSNIKKKIVTLILYGILIFDVVGLFR